jgi:hypothetical protein
MNRRRFFAACAAPFLARFAPKPQVRLYRFNAVQKLLLKRITAPLVDNLFQQSPLFERLSRKPGAVFTGGLSIQHPITINREGWYGDADL